MIPKYVLKVMSKFNDAVINSYGELVFSYKYNVFIQLNDVRNRKDFSLKLLVIGCGLNKKLAEEFKEQDFDMEVLRRYRKV